MEEPSAARVVLVGLAIGLAGCSDPGPDIDAGDGVDAALVDAGFDAGPPPPFELTSSAFTEGGMIPLRHECGPPVIADGPGENVTPPLAWTAGPAETQSYAIVVRDLDAGRLVHWVVYDLPATTLELAEDVPSGYEPPSLGGGHQAELQGSGFFGYLGMCSDGRVNSYEFTVHALSTATAPGVDQTTSETAAAAAIEAASIASASLIGES